MNNNYKILKEEEKVLVANEKLEEREYQDNILDILKLENIIEKLEKKLLNKKNILSDEKEILEIIIEDITNKKLNRKVYFTITAMAIIFTTLFVSCFLYASVEIPILSSINILTCTGLNLFNLCLLTFVFPSYLEKSAIERLEQEKEELEENIIEHERQIPSLELLISQNKTKLEELLKDKTKNNLNKEDTTIKEVSYLEELKKQKQLLAEMYQNKHSEEEGLTLTRTLK